MLDYLSEHFEVLHTKVVSGFWKILMSLLKPEKQMKNEGLPWKYIYKLVDQCLFHTEQALKYLNFIEVKEVRL